MEFCKNAEYMTLVEELRAKYRRREAEIARLLSEKDIPGILARGERIRNALRSHLLDPELKYVCTGSRVTEVLQFPGYRVEKLAISGGAGMEIPVNLYLPVNGNPHHPAVVVTMGHWLQAKAMESNQRFCANLALRGIAAITFDPIFQGERCRYSEAELMRMFGPITEDMWMVGLHMMAGNPAYLLNKNLGALFTCEAMTVTDYLVSRKDIDCSRILAAGQSGGGTQACYLAAMDDRISGLIPIQCLSRLSITLEGGIGDCEQSFLGISAREGVEQGDLLWAVLSKSVLHSAGRDDFFSLEGVLRIQEEMTAIYEVLGQPGGYEMQLADCGHALTEQGREQIYNWICRRFSLDAAAQEIDTPVLPPEALACLTPEARWESPLTVYRNMAQTAVSHQSHDMTTIRWQIRELVMPLPECTVETLENDRFRISLAEQSALCTLTRGNGKELLVYVGTGAPDFPAVGSSTLTVLPWALETAQHKTGLGYDLETCMFNTAGVLGKNLCLSRARQILCAIRHALAQTCAATVIAHGSGAGCLCLLLAACTGEIPMALTLSDCPDSLLPLFEAEGRFLRETDMVPGLLEIADLPELRQLAGVLPYRESPFFPEQEV